MATAAAPIFKEDRGPWAARVGGAVEGKTVGGESRRRRCRWWRRRPWVGEVATALRTDHRRKFVECCKILSDTCPEKRGLNGQV